MSTKKPITKDQAQWLLENTDGFDNDNLVALGNFAESPYFNTPKSVIKSWSVEAKKKFEHEKQTFFSNARRNGIDGSVKPFAVGGSDAGIVYGVSSFKAPSTLYQEKLYPEIYGNPIRPRNEEITLRTGHRNEDRIREDFELTTGIKVMEWDVQMLNRKWPHCIADVDGLLSEDGKLGVYEGKCLQAPASQKNWRKIKQFGNIPQCIGLVPPAYRLQVWYYLAVTGLSFAYICGSFGPREDDIGYVRIPRLEPEQEQSLMEGMETFVINTSKKMRPSDADFKNKDKLLEQYSDVTRHMVLNDSPVRLPQRAGAIAARLRQLEAQKKDIDSKIKELKENCGYKNIEKDIDAAKASLAEMMYDNINGVCYDADGAAIAVTYEKSSRKSFHPEVCAAKYPEIDIDEIYYSSKRGIKVL